MNDHLPFEPDEIVVNVTDLTAGEKRLDFELPAKFAKRFSKKMKKSGCTDPQKIRNQLASFCLQHGLKRHDFIPLWKPTPPVGSPEPVLHDERAFTFSLVIDHVGEVDWPDFSSIEIKRPIREISEEMVDEEMLEQRRMAGTASDVEGAIKSGDALSCTVSIVKTASDKPLLTSDDMTIRVMLSDQTTVVGGLSIDGLSEALHGQHVGSEISIKTTVPIEYPDPTMVGSDITFNCRINRCTRMEPATIQDVLDQYQSPNEQMLRQQIKMSLQSKFDRDQKEIMASQVFDLFVDDIRLEPPERIITDFSRMLSSGVEANLMQRGYDGEQLEQAMQDRRGSIHEISTSKVKRNIIIRLLAKELGIMRSESDIIQKIAELAADQGRRPEDVRNELVNSGKIDNIGMDVLEKKTADAVIKQARVTDVPVEQWDS